jgi:uncharacterized heparinase superfamily protein
MPAGWSGERWIARWLQRRLGAVVLRGPAVVVAERTEADKAIEVEARHDGYRPGFGLIHQRRWRLEASGDALHGEDLLIVGGESASPRDVAIRFHLHPAVQASEAEGGRIRLVLPNQETWIFGASPIAAHMEESVFFPTTDRPRRTEQIVLAFNTRQAETVRWRFDKVEAAAKT